MNENDASEEKKVEQSKFNTFNANASTYSTMFRGEK